MLIVLINAVTVVIGGVIGSFLKKGIPDTLKQAILFSIGLYVVYLGITGLSSEIRSVVLLLSVVLGTLCGTALHLDDAMNRGAQRLQTALLRNREDARFAEGLCTFSSSPAPALTSSSPASTPGWDRAACSIPRSPWI